MHVRGDHGHGFLLVQKILPHSCALPAGRLRVAQHPVPKWRSLTLRPHGVWPILFLLPRTLVLNNSLTMRLSRFVQCFLCQPEDLCPREIKQGRNSTPNHRMGWARANWSATPEMIALPLGLFHICLNKVRSGSWAVQEPSICFNLTRWVTSWHSQTVPKWLCNRIKSRAKKNPDAQHKKGTKGMKGSNSSDPRRSRRISEQERNDHKGPRILHQAVNAEWYSLQGTWQSQSGWGLTASPEHIRAHIQGIAILMLCIATFRENLDACQGLLEQCSTFSFIRNIEIASGGLLGVPNEAYAFHIDWRSPNSS